MRPLLLLALLAACKPANDDDDAPTATMGLPSGDSAWEGEGVINGFTILLTLELSNDGGDLTGEATIEDDPEAPLGLGTGIYTLTGTHDPESGLIAFAPNAWVRSPLFESELIGFIGAYDPETDTIDGNLADYASEPDNQLLGGPASVTRTSGDGAALEAGDGGAGLPEGTRPYTGSQQCTSDEREAEGELTYDGAGAVSGTITFGDYTLAEGRHTFAFTGVHNPSTGGVTLVPGLFETEGRYVSFFVDATYDPSADTFNGDGRTNTGPCPPGLWKAKF
ncbi:MAG TPA: hypothetical protein PKA64_19190 [Myxococcota bacterium]|nr:hypothetical protein [Myxococcota bacterium]